MVNKPKEDRTLTAGEPVYTGHWDGLPHFRPRTTGEVLAHELEKNMVARAIEKSKREAEFTHDTVNDNDNGYSGF